MLNGCPGPCSTYLDIIPTCVHVLPVDTSPIVMSDVEDNNLFAISLDTDNDDDASSEPAAQSRTYQSEADFQKIKASYTAKIDNGNTYQDLIAAVPVLAQPEEPISGPKVKLRKKDVQLLGYAAAELYYDREYARMIELCERVKERCEVDAKAEEGLGRWVERCEGRLKGG